MNNWRFTLTVIAATTAIIGTAQAVTDTAFKYSTAKTGYFTINPGDLIPNSSSATYDLTISALTAVGSVTGCFYAGVHLPNGARIGQVAIWYVSGATGGDLQFQLARTRLADNATEFAVATNPHDDSGVHKMSAVFADAAMATVNNGIYRYSFGFCPASVDNVFHGGRITYTYTNAGD